VALQLRRLGIRNVRPLLGGYYAWRDLGYPLIEVLPEDLPPQSGQIIPAEDIA
jgi:3-mercaptopyruvate sulfurtransferase SseA